jgi:hypothetical protein
VPGGRHRRLDERGQRPVLRAAPVPVLAAGAQSHAAGEALDLALRRAFWTHSRSISHRAVILEVAAEAGPVDVTRLATALDRREYDLLLFLAQHPRQVFSRNQLLRSVWGTVHSGVGYRLDADAEVTVEE